MTPLANHWLRKIANGDYVDPPTRRLLANAQCFDATPVWELANVIGKLPVTALENTFFAPATDTWIEITQGDADRMALGIMIVGNDEIAVVLITRDFCRPIAVFKPRSASAPTYISPDASDRLVAEFWWVASAYLAIINTPRLVVRDTSPPHKGIQRRLRQAGQEIELRSWSTLKLELTPRLATGDDTHHERISGRKCLHFCRSHLRVQRGKLVVVRPHWRGDAAIGVKCKDYEIAA